MTGWLNLECGVIITSLSHASDLCAAASIQLLWFEAALQLFSGSEVVAGTVI